jgi:branched-chain amino acid transport system ATP-binding protein
MSQESLLSVHELTVRFGGLVALNALDLEVAPGHIFALVGPNGAGKTTVLNCVSGFVIPSAGRVSFAGADLLRQRPERRARLGITRTFQNLQLFSTATVMGNLLAAQHAHLHTGLLRGMLGGLLSFREERAARERASETMAMLGLTPYAHAIAGDLPFGVQQLVGVARALVTRPRLVLLDEPAAGMSADDIDGLAASLRRWRDELGTTLVLIEHNMRLVHAAADHVCVLDYGSKLAEGNPAEVLSDARVLEAYLGHSGLVAGSR